MKAKKKLYDLEKKQREISEKLDKFDYSYNKEQKKVNDINEIYDKDNNGNLESCAKIDKDYQKVLDTCPTDLEAFINLVKCYREIGNPKIAYDLFFVRIILIYFDHLLK